MNMPICLVMFWNETEWKNRGQKRKQSLKHILTIGPNVQINGIVYLWLSKCLKKKSRNENSYFKMETILSFSCHVKEGTISSKLISDFVLSMGEGNSRIMVEVIEEVRKRWF